MMEPARHDDYANVRHHDDHDESSTEVEESLMGDEKSYQKDAMFQRRKPKSLREKLLAPFSSGRWLIDTALLLVIIGLLVKEQYKERRLNPWQIGGDMTGVAPEIPMKITTFKMDQSYAPNDTSKFFTPEVMNKWNDLMPIGMGFQWVNDTDKYHDLPTPIIWPEKTVFTTSVTHQLHCLFTLTQIYSAYHSGHELPKDSHWHALHCFDYMRQAVMCSADMALEGLETTFPDHNGGSDGWDSKHVCKDWSQVTSYLERVRAYDDRQIY